MDVVNWNDDIVDPVSNWFSSFSFHINQSENSWHGPISKFDLEKFKVKVMSELKGQDHIIDPVTNQCTSFLVYVSRTNSSWDMAYKVHELEETYHHKKVSNRIPPKSNQVIGIVRDVAIKFCSDWMGGSQSIVQTNTFLISVTAVTLYQGQGKSYSTFPQTYTFFISNI